MDRQGEVRTATKLVIWSRQATTTAAQDYKLALGAGRRGRVPFVDNLLVEVDDDSMTTLLRSRGTNGWGRGQSVFGVVR